MKLPLFNTYKRSLLKRCVFIMPAPTNIRVFSLSSQGKRVFALLLQIIPNFCECVSEETHGTDLSTSFRKYPWESYHILESSQPQSFRLPVLAMTHVNKHIKHITLINLSYPNNRGV